MQLNHGTRPLPGGGMVLVLDTGAVIGPEAEAMLQALYSRSPASVVDHLQRVTEQGPERFMSQWYVGYGDASIGDCGSVTLFIEGVSMLVAKAVQDWMLYSGQECSTRYLDFARQPFVDPVGTQESGAILERWRSFYIKGLETMIETLKGRFPRGEDEKEKDWEKAIKARAFDICRGFLPAGAATSLSWHGNLRQTADMLVLLKHHPLTEVRTVARAMEEALKEKFPSSFSAELRGTKTQTPEQVQAVEEYYKWVRGTEYLYRQLRCPGFAVMDDSVDRDLILDYRKTLEHRPRRASLPKYMAECGTLRFEFLLDFGSFRDIQRHRAVIQRMPLVTMKFGFHPWYLESLTPELRAEAFELIARQEAEITGLGVHENVKQYYVAMGYQQPMRLTGDLPALVWLVELRSTRFVHPTLRERARQMASELKRKFGEYGLVLHLDPTPDRFDVRRGTHDIELRNT